MAATGEVVQFVRKSSLKHAIERTNLTLALENDSVRITTSVPTIKKSGIRQVLQILVLGLVAWGIYQSVRSAGTELASVRENVKSRADQLRLQASEAVDLAEKQRLFAEADQADRAVVGYWKASPSGLLFAGLLYAIGMVPASLYWKRCLVALGQKTDLLETLWAYFYGNLGKYFPGKAMVLVLRIGALNKFGVHKTATGLTIFMETLTLMSVGGAIAALCLVVLNIDWRLTILALGLLSVTFLPTCPPVLRWLLPKLKGVDEAELSIWTGQTNWSLAFAGWLSLTITWVFFGLSLFVVLQSTSISETTDTGLLQLMLSAQGACALAVVLGFVSLIPGGAGVREVVLSMILTPVVGPIAALSGAIWMRIVWLATELITAGGLGIFRALRRSQISQLSPSNLQ